MIFAPAVRITVSGVTLPLPTELEISVDVGQPSDHARLAWPYSLELARSLSLDAPAVISLGGSPIITGRIATNTAESDDSLSIDVYCNVHRLVKESIRTGFAIRGKAISAVLRSAIGPWFPAVEFSNAQDRDIRRGSRRRSSFAAREPAIDASTLQAIGTRVEAGAKRWEAIERITRPLGLLAWSRADGQALVVARPQYNQSTQYRFVKTSGSSNVTGLSLTRSVAGRYATIEVAGTARPLGKAPSRRPRSSPGRGRRRTLRWSSVGRAVDQSGDFQAEKALFAIESSTFPRDAQTRAEKLLAQMSREAHQIEITTPGFGQESGDSRSLTLYAPDTIAHVRAASRASRGDGRDATYIDDTYYVTSVRFSESGDSGPETKLTLIPKGTQLA